MRTTPAAARNLRAAARAGDVRELRRLVLDVGVDVECASPEGYTALHAAAKRDCVNSLRVLICELGAHAALLPHLSANAAREHLAELTAPVREMFLKTSGGRARAFVPEALLSLPPLARTLGDEMAAPLRELLGPLQSLQQEKVREYSPR